MTLAEMDKVIQDYCEEVSKRDETMCESCEIKHLCEPIMGMFEVNPTALEKAYNIVNGLKGGDAVSHPSHYNQGGIECIDAMVAAFGKEAVGVFCLLNAFKYLWRTEHKNGKEDLNKAMWYLNKRLELMSSD